MQASQFFISTLKEAPSDAEIVSHKLMMRAGLIKKLGAGLYTYMPMGLRTIRKVEAIIREEMNRAGAVELVMPVVQPAELWQETGRFDKMGDELLRFKDRHQRDFCFGPTHEEVITDLMALDAFPPAPGQGAICIESRIGDTAVTNMLQAIDHKPTGQALACERAFLAALDGSCRTPIAGYAEIDGDRLSFAGLILTPDGTLWHEAKADGRAADAAEIGRNAGDEVRARAGTRLAPDQANALLVRLIPCPTQIRTCRARAGLAA